MGVNLKDIVPKKEISFDSLKHKKVAIDAFNSLYQFLASIRGADGTPLKDSKGRITSHLQGLFSRSLNLMAKGVKIVYVFDGEPPALKGGEIASRISRKEEAGGKYKEAIQEEDVDAMNKYAKQNLRLTEPMLEEAKELVRALGLPCVGAPSEADAQMVWMCKNGDVDYIASTDYDGILLGVLRLVRNLTLSQRRKVPGGKYVTTFLELIETKEVLSSLELDQDHLIALGMLVGTDYNPGGVRGIGPKKALTLVRKHEDINDIFKEVDITNWKEIYNLFVDPKFSKEYKLEWNEIDIDKIKDLLVKRHEFNEERVDNLIAKYKDECKDHDQKGLSEFF